MLCARLAVLSLLQTSGGTYHQRAPVPCAYPACPVHILPAPLPDHSWHSCLGLPCSTSPGRKLRVPWELLVLLFRPCSSRVPFILLKPWLQWQGWVVAAPLHSSLPSPSGMSLGPTAIGTGLSAVGS